MVDHQMLKSVLTSKAGEVCKAYSKNIGKSLNEINTVKHAYNVW